jgi:SAM-dependent methyltransferase
VAKGEETARKKVSATSVDLREEILRLAPWHLEVEVGPGLTTAVALEAGTSGGDGPVIEVGFSRPEASFKAQMGMLYPDGLEGRRVLDCACNCGAYLFWAKELGAGECFGFDVREHWIAQARFLQEHRSGPTEDMHFEVCDLYDLPELTLQPFDIVLFNGIFYHLPDPVRGLKIAADLASELMIVDTATRSGFDEPHLALVIESREHPMSGVYGPSWLPTGPEVLSILLKWAGFVETQIPWWIEETRQGWGWINMAATKRPGLLRPYCQTNVYECFKLFNRGSVSDIAHGVRAFFAEDAEFHENADRPDPAVWRGRAAIETYLRENRRTRVVELLLTGDDTVLAIFHESGPGEGSDHDVDAYPAWAFTFHDGRVSVLREFRDKRKARRTLGL